MTFFHCAECREPLIAVYRTAHSYDLRCPRCDRDLLEKEGIHGVLSDPPMTDQWVFDRAFAALGYTSEDHTPEAEVWVGATFDNDARWLETATPEQIRRSFKRWHTREILRNGKRVR